MRIPHDSYVLVADGAKMLFFRNEGDAENPNLTVIAAEAAQRINRAALANEFERLIIVAPPKTLGELRKHYHKQVESRITAEIPKDLTGHPVQKIEAVLQNYEGASS